MWDCAEVYYDSTYFILVSRLNANGAGNAGNIHFPTTTWTHMAVTYSSSQQQLLVYVNGQVVTTVNGVAHIASTLGTPAIGGEGDSNTNNPVQAAYINLRQYNYALTQAQVQTLVTSGRPHLQRRAAHSGPHPHVRT